jgi:hypothetical protein
LTRFDPKQACAGDHVLSGSLELLELVGFVGNPAADLIQIAGDVGQLDSEGTDAASVVSHKYMELLKEME